MATPEQRYFRRVRVWLDVIGAVTNFGGATILFVYIVFLLPTSLPQHEIHRIARNILPVFVAFIAVVGPIGWWWFVRKPLRPIAAWLGEKRPAGQYEQVVVLGFPGRFAARAFVLWLLGDVLFTVLIVTTSSQFKLQDTVVLAMTVALTGAIVCGVLYLAYERMLRPVAALVLNGAEPPRTRTASVGLRMLMAWLVGTGIPIFSVAVFSAMDLFGADYDHTRLVGTFAASAAVTLTVGVAASYFAAHSVIDPIGSMRGALAEVEAGNFDLTIPVDDGSEVGQLQAGFNRMTAGLNERERLHTAFGAYVDPLITQRVLDEGVDLEGQELDLTLMFVDVQGFTTFAETATAHEVFARLNQLFGVVVPAVLAHGGHANKFIGDGLLAIFGAPDPMKNHAAAAVDAGLEIVERVAEEFGGELRIGVGINTGRCVAGTLGGGGRLDFTVIGDAVNTAARVEEATRTTRDSVLITEATRERLGRRGDDWVARPPIELKGKAVRVALYAPPGSGRLRPRMLRRPA